MDIINRLENDEYEQIDELLTFISIYDDTKRTEVFMELLEAHRGAIKGKVCVELGCGLGIFSERMAQLGAARVYAVERNPYLFQLARKRLSAYKNVTLILDDAANFQPPEPVDVLVHEFFGQMLYDEDLYILENLRYKPKLVLPNGGRLRAGVMDIEEFDDQYVDSEFIKYLNGVLVSGLFDEEDCQLEIDVARWRYGRRFKKPFIVDIDKYQGDLLYFGLELEHDGQVLCRAGQCNNWSYVWTYRGGDRFYLDFLPAERGYDVEFHWV